MDIVIEFAIDGKPVSAREGESLLDVARANGIFIPALCHHKAVSSFGACRLCLVEIEKRGRKRIVASCGFLAEEGLGVTTTAPKAVKARNVAMELLLARCPRNEYLLALADLMGVPSTRFEKRDKKCILCGLCVRVCREVIRAECIVFSGRGYDREVTTPYHKPATDCIGCGSCVAICPTGTLHQREEGTAAILQEWQTVLPQASCPDCGVPFAPFPQMDFIRSRLKVRPDPVALCPECRRNRMARQAVFWEGNTPSRRERG
ncbi:MAG: 2Fe-2S iron-sulfur cluster-binding protein [Planctomycetota bacterium]